MSKRRQFSTVAVLIVGSSDLAFEFACTLYRQAPASITFACFDASNSCIDLCQRVVTRSAAWPAVRCAAHSLPPTEEFLLNFELVVAVRQPQARILTLNDFCRVRQRWHDALNDFVEEAIGFVVLDVFGLVGSVFCDFGNSFAYREADKFYPATSAAIRYRFDCALLAATVVDLSAFIPTILHRPSPH